jgi:3',5'-cyclic AMP phosphodiesterase CpdA
MASYVVLQITDVHLTSKGVLPPGVRPRDNLVGGLALLDEAGISPDVVLFTGDLADAGEAECYEDLAAIVESAPALEGATVIYLPGNHDARAPFRRHLLDLAPTSEPIDAVYRHGGLRIVALDSTVPGEAHGELGEATLELLRHELEQDAPDGTIVALHHPPIPSPIAPMSALRLCDPGKLEDAIRGTDVRLVVCGHNHHAAAGSLGDAPVWVSPASAYLADVTSRETFRSLPAAAFSMIDIDKTTTVTTVVPIPASVA